MTSTNTATTPRHVLVACCLLIVVMGATSVAFNVYDALHSGTLPGALAWLLGVIPVVAAGLMSHVVAYHRRGGTALKVLTYAVMVGAMAQSMVAIATVLWPARGAWSVLFGAVLDVATLVALHILLDARTAAAADASAAEMARADAEAARAEASAAAARATELEAALAAERAGSATQSAAAAAELAASRAELEAARAKVPPRNSRRGSARKPTRNSGRTSARKPAAGSAPEVPAEADLDTEAQALLILGQEPGISGSQLGLRLGKSDRYGRDLIKRLAPSVPGPDAPQ